MKNNELVTLVIIVFIVTVGAYFIADKIFQPKQSGVNSTPMTSNPILTVITTSQVDSPSPAITTPTPTLLPPITYPSSLHYAGSSNRDECFNVTGDTNADFTINSRGSIIDRFSVIVIDMNRDNSKVLVMQSGPFYGHRIMPMTTGKYCFNLIAKTTWTIDIDFHSI